LERLFQTDVLIPDFVRNISQEPGLDDHAYKDIPFLGTALGIYEKIVDTWRFIE